MRHNNRKRPTEKVLKHHLKYVLIEKETNKASIYHYKTKLAEKIGVSTRTIDRNKYYSNDKYQIYPINSLEL